MAGWLRRAVGTLAAIGLSAGLLAACGEGGEEEPAAAAILEQTLADNLGAIEDAYLSLSVRLDPEGPRAGRGPVTITLLGPFRAARPDEAEHFAVELAAVSAEETVTADVLSTGSRLLVSRDGATYDAGSVAAARDGERLPVTGLHPQRWIDAARMRGRERAAGADTVRIAGTVDIERLLPDLGGLLPTTAGVRSGTTQLSPKLRRQIADAVDSSSIDVWTGADDRLLRQIAVRIAFSFDDDEPAPAPLRGLGSATINVHLRLDDVNEGAAPASTFAAPAGIRARPLAVGGRDVADVVKAIAARLAAG